MCEWNQKVPEGEAFWGVPLNVPQHRLTGNTKMLKKKRPQVQISLEVLPLQGERFTTTNSTQRAPQEPRHL